MDEHSLKLLQSAVRVAQNTGYSEAAALTFLLCDIASTFPDEVKHIWRKKWTFTKVMYLIARYYGLLLAIAMVVHDGIPDPSAKFCRTYIRIMSMIGSKFYVAIIDIICVTRVFALYGHNRKIFALLALTSIVDVAIGLYCVKQVTEFGSALPPRNELSRRYGCPFLLDPVSKSMVRWYTVTWILTLGNATVFLLFTLYKLKDSMKDEFGNARLHILTDRSLISPFLVAFVRDGTLNFLLIAGILSLSAIMSFYRAGFYYTPTWPWLYVIFSYAGCRLILDVHRAAARMTHITKMDTIEPMEFARNPGDRSSRC